MKFLRGSLLAALLCFSALTLTACGSDGSTDIAPYAGATAFTADKTTQDTFKNALKGVKEAKLETFAVKDDPAAVKAFYESQFKDTGWTDRHEMIEDASKQQTTSNGWALAYEKGPKLVSLTLTPANLAAGRFPEAKNQNVLVIISATK